MAERTEEPQETPPRGGVPQEDPPENVDAILLSRRGWRPLARALLLIVLLDWLVSSVAHSQPLLFSVLTIPAFVLYLSSWAAKTVGLALSRPPAAYAAALVCGVLHHVIPYAFLLWSGMASSMSVSSRNVIFGLSLLMGIAIAFQAFVIIAGYATVLAVGLRRRIWPGREIAISTVLLIVIGSALAGAFCAFWMLFVPSVFVLIELPLVAVYQGFPLAVPFAYSWRYFQSMRAEARGGAPGPKEEGEGDGDDELTGLALGAVADADGSAGEGPG